MLPSNQILLFSNSFPVLVNLGNFSVIDYNEFSHCFKEIVCMKHFGAIENTSTFYRYFHLVK